MWSLYKITNQMNGKIYVGQTVRSLERRFKEYTFPSMKKRNPHMGRAINKYGIYNFTIELIGIANTQELANHLEIEFIKQYDSRNPDRGYNIAAGGNVPHNYKGKNKMSEEREQQIVSDYRAGLTFAELQSKHNTSASCIFRVIQRNDARLTRLTTKGQSWKMIDGKRVWYKKEI